MTNRQFVIKVYDYVLGRPDVETNDPEGGLDYWTAALDLYEQTGGVQGQRRGAMVETLLTAAHEYKGKPYGKEEGQWGQVPDLLDNKIVVAERFAVEWGLNYNTETESITQGKAIAAAITSTSIDAAIALIGIDPGQLDLN
jgi:hypothetical protein